MSRPADSRSAVKPRLRVGPVLVVLAGLTALAPLSMDIYAPSLPQLGKDLGAADWLTQASITGCLLGIGVGQLLWGPLSDRFGRRPVILLGVVGWTAASVLSIFSVNAEMLLAVRVFAGLFGAACIVAARSVVRDITEDTHARASRIGLMSLVSAGAPIAAPVAGAAIAAAWGWRADFVALALVGIVLGVVFGLIVPETLAASERTTRGLGIVSGLGSASRSRELVGIALSLACFAFGFYAYVATASFIVERERGYPALVFAVVFGSNALAMVFSTLVFRRLTRRWSAKGLLGAGLGGGIVAGVILFVCAAAGGPDWLLWAASMLFTGSAGFVLPAAHAAGQSVVWVASGAASAATGAAQFLGGVLGSPVTGVLGTTAVVLGSIVVVCCVIGLFVWFSVLRRTPAVLRASASA